MVCITEKNKWYKLTHLGESSYCLQINPDYQTLVANFQVTDTDLKNPQRFKPKFTPQPATQWIVQLYKKFESPLGHFVCMEIYLIFFILLCYERIYMYTTSAIYLLNG